MYPDWSESQVKYAESRMINYCTPVEIATFLKHLANKIYKAEMIKLTLDNAHKTKKRKKK